MNYRYNIIVHKQKIAEFYDLANVFIFLAGFYKKYEQNLLDIEIERIKEDTETVSSEQI